MKLQPTKFSLRQLMALVLLLAILFSVTPFGYRNIRYFSQMRMLRNWESKVKRLPRSPESISLPMGNGKQLSLSTVEKTFPPDFSWATMEAGAEPDPTRFFVLPPGKWVDSIDEAVAAWQQHVRKQN